MKRFDSKLKISASVFALLCGGALASPPALATTIDSDETGVEINADITGDLLVTSTGSITPDGLVVNADITGNLSNAGLIEALGTETSPGTGADVIALDFNGTVGGNVVNSGVINAEGKGSVEVTQITGFHNGDFVYGSASGADINGVTGDVTNTGVISALGTADLVYNIGTAATPAADVTVDVWAYAYAIGLEVDNPGGTVSNATGGSITASASSNGTFDIVAEAAKVDADLKRASVSATATGVYLSGGTYDVSNSGTITADSSADMIVDGDATATVDSALLEVTAEVSAYAYGVLARGTTTGFANTGTISADAAASLALTMSADAVSGASRAWASNNNQDVTASASAVQINTLNGPFTNGGTISATASALVSGTVSAVGGNATASIDNADYSASALAVYIQGGEHELTNTGTITANASLTVTNSVKATGTASEAYVWSENSDSAYAYGLLAYGTTTGFTNTGSIAATATNNVITSAAANGATTATASMSNNVWASAYGVYINTAEGNVKNSGTISATVSSSLSATQSAVAADSSAYVWASDELWGSAYGFEIDNLTGTLTNESTGVISATVDVVMSHDLSASGATATVSLTTLSQSAYAWGVLVEDGKYALVNSGSITADAAIAATIKATAVADEFDAFVYLTDIAQTAWAYGVRAEGEVTGVTNAGTITAIAAADLTETVSATGVTSASVSVSNDIEVLAYGIFVEQPLDGDIANTGTITASASSKVNVTASASIGADPGFVLVDTEVFVHAVGVSADFAPPPAKAVQEFSNGGTITATGLLSVNTVVPASTDPVPTLDTAATVHATGVFLTGSLGSVNNSGTISASVEAANVDEALAVGLFLPEGADGLEITNSGTLSASVKGTAASATAVALQIGPLEAPDEEGEGLDETAVGVITVTNTGTISATNEAGGAYGIFAGFAEDPLVINQQGGSISAATAIEIENGNADVLNWTGGSIKGLVSADGADTVNVLQAVKDGKGVATTITAGTDFALDGAGELNIGGGKGAPVTFDFAGKTSNVGATTISTDATLIVQPTGEMQGNTFTMQPDSKVTFIFNPTDAGLITMTGDATIDGTLGAVALPGLYGDKGSHVVIESDTKVVGTFDNTAITGDTLLIDFTATVHAQDVTISWERTAFNEVAGLTINSTSVATALENGYDPTRPASKNDPELNDILAGLFTLTDAEKYDRVLNSWSGSEHAQVMRAAANLSEPYLMTIGEHLNDIRRAGAPDGQVVMLRPKGSSASIAPLSAAGASAEEQRFAFWGRAYGRWADTNGDIEADGYDEDTYGAVLGFDFLVSPNVTVGIAGGYTDDDIDFDDGDAGKIKRWTIGGYLSAQFDAFYIDGSFSYASDDYRVERTIVYGDTSCLAFNCTTGAASKYDGDGFLGHAEIGYIFDMGNGMGIQPFAGVNFSSVDSDPFAETGGGDLGLEVLDGTGKSLQSRLGARLTGEWGSGETRWFPELRVEWRHEFEDDPAWIVASMNGLPDEPFTAIGSKVTSDLAVVGAGVTAVLGNGVGIFLDYQGAFGSGYNGHVIQGGVRLKF